MAIIRHLFGARDAQYPAANFAQFKAVAGTNFPVDSLAFDATTAETVYFRFPAVQYGSGDITVRIRWYADTATSGGVAFGAQLAAVTPNTDSQDIETKAFATEVVATDTHLGTTGQRLHEMTVALNQLDSIAGGDACVLKLTRVVADAGDTMTGDALVTGLEVEYSSV